MTHQALVAPQSSTLIPGEFSRLPLSVQYSEIDCRLPI